MALTRTASLLFVLAATAFSAAQQTQDQPLQFTIRQTSPSPILQAEMRNTGKDPVTLCFERQMAVEAIHLSLTDAKGETTALTVKHPVTTDPNFMAKRTGLGIVTLQPGESRVLPLDLRYYKDDIGLPLAPGQYTLQATHTEPPPGKKPVTPDVLHKSCWTGSVSAPPLPVTLP